MMDNPDVQNKIEKPPWTIDNPNIPNINKKGKEIFSNPQLLPI